MLSKHPYLNLNIGLVKEYYAVVNRWNKRLWKKRGFKRVHFYSIFGHFPNPFKITMLGIPQKLEEFGVEKLKGSRIIDVSTCCGTYGMGGPGFLGLKLKGKYGIRWLNYCVWSAEKYILYNDSILESYLEYSRTDKSKRQSDNYLNNLKMFRDLLTDMTIQEIALSEESLEIVLIDSHHKIHTLKSNIHTEMFYGQDDSQKKSNSNETDSMKDLWLVTYDKTVLKV